MTRIFNDIRSGVRSLLISYPTLYLPASIIIMALVYSGLSQGDHKALMPGFFLSFILFTCLPAVAAARGLQNAGHRLKSFSLIGGDALMAALLLYIIPLPSLDSLTSIGLAIFLSGAVFILITLLIKRGLHVAMGVDRMGLVESIRQIWQNAPGLLTRMGAGVLFSALSLGVVHFIMTSLPFAHESQHRMVGLALSCALIIPACFMPFILLAEGLKPAAPKSPDEKE